MVTHALWEVRKNRENIFQVEEIDRNINRKSWDVLRRLLNILKAFDAWESLEKHLLDIIAFTFSAFCLLTDCGHAMALHSHSPTLPMLPFLLPKDVVSFSWGHQPVHKVNEWGTFSRSILLCNLLCQKNICSLDLLPLSYASHCHKELCPQCRPWLQEGGGGIPVVPLILSMSSHIRMSLDLQMTMLNDN